MGNFQDETGKQRQAEQNEQLELLGQVMPQEVETEDPKSTQENALTLETYEHQFECLTDETSLRHWVKQWMKQEWLALDTETTDLDPKKAQLLGLSICCESGVACYILWEAHSPYRRRHCAPSYNLFGSCRHWKSGASPQIRSQRVGMARMGDSGALVGHHGCPSITQTGPTSWVGFSGKGVFKL